MDRARSFDYVQQIPRTTIREVLNSDSTYEKQVLLNETWENYCKRRKVPHRAKETHEKWVTETWDEYLDRAVNRSRTLAVFDHEQNEIIADREAAQDQRDEVSRSVVEHLMAGEKRRIETTRHPCSLTLLLDFEQLRQDRFRRERLEVEEEHAAKSLWVVQEMEEERKRLIDEFERKRQEMLAAEEAKRRAEEEARLAEEEARRQEEERKKAEEEAKRRAELEAERKRRAEEEEAKRAERKRKEDERRAKAKAEREARNKATTGAKPGSSGASDQDPHPAHRAKRIARMNDHLPSTLDQIRAIAAASSSTPVEGGSSTSSPLTDYCKKICNLLGNGNTLFHTCVYVGAVNSAGDTVEYIAASDNCSENLLQGQASLPIKDSAVLTEFAQNPKAAPAVVGPMQIASPQKSPLVHIGSQQQQWPPSSGECAFFPIRIQDGEKLWGVLAVDTASNNTRDASSTIQMPHEEHCYKDESNIGEPVSISPEVISFLEKVADLSSNVAATNSASSSSSSSAQFEFDLEKLRNASNLGHLFATLTHLLRKSLSAVNSGNNNKNTNEVNATAAATAAAGGDNNNTSSSSSSSSPVDCYVSLLVPDTKSNKKKPETEALIVAHNGYSITTESSAAERDQDAPHHLVGGKLSSASNPNAQTFSFNASSSSSRFSWTADVASSETCAVYDKALSQEKTSGESLLLIPIVVPTANNNNSSSSSSSVFGVVGISGLSDESNVEPVVELFWNHVRALILALLKRHALSSTCAQAVEWLSIATGCRNVYISLSHSNNKKSSSDLVAAPLEIVAASNPQKWLEGKTWTAADGGISHNLLGNSVAHTHEASATSKHISSLASSSGVKLFGDETALKGDTKGFEAAQLVLCTIAQNKPDAQVHGVLYGDTLHAKGVMKNETISSSDVDVFRLTAQLLAATLDGDQDDENSADENDKKPLAIETDLGGGSSSSSSGQTSTNNLAFLARLLRYAKKSVRGIETGQLQELARYPAPPPVIPQTVASAIAILGSSKVQTDWKKVRKKIKQTLLDQINVFDPTSTKVKKSCVLRSKQLTKGLTASDVFTKGSHPASCLFTWVFICLLLRKFSKSMRDAAEGSTSDEAKVAAVLSASFSGASSFSVAAASTTGEEEEEGGDDEGEGGDDEEDVEDEDDDDEGDG